MSNKLPLEPGDIYTGYENCHSGSYGSDLLLLLSIDADAHGIRTVRFGNLGQCKGTGVKQHRYELTFDECNKHLKFIGNLRDAFVKMGWIS